MAQMVADANSIGRSKHGDVVDIRGPTRGMDSTHLDVQGILIVVHAATMIGMEKSSYIPEGGLC